MRKQRERQIIYMADNNDYLMHPDKSSMSKHENDTNEKKKYISQLNRFFIDFSIINKGYLQYKKESDRYLSSDFSFFRYLNTNEVSLSNYFGLLLDTQGSHGQQDLFLNLFIDFLNKKGLSIPKRHYKIKLEYQADGRIDIFLYHGDTAVIIENKPYSSDGDQQLSRYYKSIGERYTSVFILYLSPKGGPSEESLPPKLLSELEANGRYRTITLYDFGKEFVDSCEKLCESHKFRYFLNDLKLFLLSEFDIGG